MKEIKVGDCFSDTDVSCELDVKIKVLSVEKDYIKIIHVLEIGDRWDISVNQTLLLDAPEDFSPIPESEFNEAFDRAIEMLKEARGR